jgi:hypothetical protein
MSERRTPFKQRSPVSLGVLAVLAAAACAAQPPMDAMLRGSDAPVVAAASVAARPGMRIAADARSFERGDGSPFFYLADTAWTAPTRLTLAEMDEYLADRAGKGFTVIQTILVPWDAKWSGNVAGEKPFVDGDETRPNEAYWKHVDAWLEKIIARGMVPAVVPFWLRGRNDDKGPVPADAEAMAAYARFVGARYAKHEMIWLLGADAPGDAWTQHLARFAEELERAAGRGTAAPAGTTPRAAWLMTHHPEGGGTSARLFHDAPWLDFNGLQSGHWLGGRHDALIDQAWGKRPVKPVIDLEPAYEHITDALAEVKPGVKLVQDFDVRRQAYQALFAGAAGHAYGCAEVYEFHTEKQGKAKWTVGTHWREAMQFPGSGQLRHLRTLMEQLPMLGRVPDQSLIGGTASDDMAQRRRAIRSATGERACIYLPQGGRISLSAQTLDALAAHVPHQNADHAKVRWRATWHDPRTGERTPIGASTAGEPLGTPLDATSPTEGTGQDWVLVVEVLWEADVPTGTGEGTPQTAPASPTR